MILPLHFCTKKCKLYEHTLIKVYLYSGKDSGSDLTTLTPNPPHDVTGIHGAMTVLICTRSSIVGLDSSPRVGVQGSSTLNLIKALSVLTCKVLVEENE